MRSKEEIKQYSDRYFKYEQELINRAAYHDLTNTILIAVYDIKGDVKGHLINNMGEFNEFVDEFYEKYSSDRVYTLDVLVEGEEKYEELLSNMSELMCCIYKEASIDKNKLSKRLLINIL